MKKYLFFLLTLHCGVHAKQAEWNIYMYMEAGSSLHQAALKNLNDLAVYKPESINIFVLFHYQGSTAMLYQIKKNVIKQLQEVPLGSKASEAFVPVVQKLEKTYPADKHLVILWNHGFGILEPRWNEQEQDWEVVIDDPDYQECPLRSCKSDQEHTNHKGMLVNMETKTCMGNEELIAMCDQLAAIFGKKIDILGLDMCKGAMLEHAYQLRNSIEILIGSQECELKDGWPYALLLHYLKKNSALEPRQLATAIIQSYKAYYESHAPLGIYTQSAFEVNLVEKLYDQFNVLAKILIQLLDHEDIKQLLKEVRNHCRPFCDAPMYLDCYCFLDNLIHAVATLPEEQVLQALKDACQKGQELLAKMVIANATGPEITDDAHGVSIYHPRKTIDPSYVHVPFAQDSVWYTYIEKFIKVL